MEFLQVLLVIIIIVQIVWPITMGVPSATGASQYGGGHGSTISRSLYYMYHTSDDTSYAYRLLRSGLQQSDAYWRITKNPYVTESYVIPS